MAKTVSLRLSPEECTKSSSERMSLALRPNKLSICTYQTREGTSTTSLIQRILRPGSPRPDQRLLRSLLDDFTGSISPSPPIIDFGLPDGPKGIPQTEGRSVIYVGGSWDCFGAGHVEYLRRAKEVLPAHKRPSLAVGIYSDEVRKQMSLKWVGCWLLK